MRRCGQLGVLIIMICGLSAAQEMRTYSISGTSLAIPAHLLPPEGEPIKCGLPIISHVLRHASESPAYKVAVTSTLLIRPVLQTSVTRNGFCVHYDTSGSNVPFLLDGSGVQIAGTAHAYVDSIFSILSYVAPYESAILHYPAAPEDGTLGGGPECDIYIMELGKTYGYTTPDNEVVEGGTSPSFMTIDNDYVFVNPAANRGLPALKVTIAHELHHVIQIGHYGFWFDDAFYHEITSTWMEDVVYPDVNDYFNYTGASWGHYRNPETPFTSSDGFIMYSRATWGHYVAKRFGIDVMRETWIPSVRPQLAIDQALRAHGSDFGTAYAEWSLWNYYTGVRSNPSKYYADGAWYPPIAQSTIEFSGTSRDLANSLRSLAARYYLIERGTDTMAVVLANTDVAGTLNTPIAGVEYTLRLRSTRLDDSYLLTPIGIYSKLDAANTGLWSVCYVTRDSAYRFTQPSSVAFPQPFKPGTQTHVYLPVNCAEPQQGALYIFSASAELVREYTSTSSSVHSNKQVFSWDGRTDDGDVAPSGIYFYVIELPGMRVKGKIALVRE